MRLLLLVGGLSLYVFGATAGPTPANEPADPFSVIAQGKDRFTAKKNLKNAQMVAGLTKKQATAPSAENAKALAAARSDAQAFADQTAAQNPQDAALLAVTSVVAAQLGDNKTAVARADKALALAQAQQAPPEEMTELLKVRAVAEAASGDRDRANADAKAALKLTPDDEAARRIEVLTRRRDLPRLALSATVGGGPPPVIQELIDSVRAPVVNRPEGFDASVGHTKDAETDLKLGDYRRMSEEATAALARLPDNPKAYMQRAFASLMLKDYDRVFKDADAGLKLKPGNAALLGLRAAAENETGRASKALDDAARALDDNPKAPFAWLQKGLAREKLAEGNDEWLSDIKNAADLDPQFEHFYLEALARRAGPAERPAPASRGGVFQRWVLPVAVSVGSVAVAAWLLFGAFFRRTKRAAPSAPRAGEPLEGRLLAGQFRVVRELGRGGMGIVYEAYDTRLERAVALKRLADGLKDDPAGAERFLKEAKLVAGLRHENIVVIHSAFEHEGEIYCVFEKVEGETLHDVMAERGRIPPRECLNYLAPVCAALDYAHKLKVIHRDLKPANIMLEGGKVKVMDFGIARRMRSGKGVTMTDMLVGTPAYMAPEQQFGEVSPESDLYALAVTAYQLLTGRLPFEGQGLQQDKLEGRFPPPSSLIKEAGGLDAFFARAFAPDRAKRFHGGAEFLAGFEKALG